MHILSSSLKQAVPRVRHLIPREFMCLSLGVPPLVWFYHFSTLIFYSCHLRRYVSLVVNCIVKCDTHATVVLACSFTCLFHTSFHFKLPCYFVCCGTTRYCITSGYCFRWAGVFAEGWDTVNTWPPRWKRGRINVSLVPR